MWNRVKDEWHPDNAISPDAITAGSGVSVLWRCRIDITHEWSTPLSNRTRLDELGHCPHCNFPNNQSQPERALRLLLEAMGLHVESNVRGVLKDRLELDLYIPSERFAIEYNGLNWHTSDRVGSVAHARKAQLCEKEGIELYVVWEDDWRTKRDFIIRDIASKLGLTKKVRSALEHLPVMLAETVSADSLTPIAADNDESIAFLAQNCLRGNRKNANKFMLADENGIMRALLLVITTGRPGEYQIQRYATAGEVEGGLEALLSYAQMELGVQKWSVYADVAHREEVVYEDAGFTFEHRVAPSYSYLHKGQRESNMNFDVKRFKTDLSLRYEEGLSVKELVELNDLRRIYNYGKKHYAKVV